jgi:hypothetical protein
MKSPIKAPGAGRYHGLFLFMTVTNRRCDFFAANTKLTGLKQVQKTSVIYQKKKKKKKKKTT